MSAESFPGDPCPAVNPPVFPGPCVQRSYPSADEFGLYVELPDETDYILGYDVAFGGTISSLRIHAQLGTGVATVKKNGVAVPDLTSIAFGPARSEIPVTANNLFSPGDDLILSIDEGSEDLINVSATLVFDRTIVP